MSTLYMHVHTNISATIPTNSNTCVTMHILHMCMYAHTHMHACTCKINQHHTKKPSVQTAEYYQERRLVKVVRNAFPGHRGGFLECAVC